MAALTEVISDVPQGASARSKHFVGFYDSDDLVAVLDLITGFPQADDAFIGWFMVDAELQGQVHAAEDQDQTPAADLRIRIADRVGTVAGQAEAPREHPVFFHAGLQCSDLRVAPVGSPETLRRLVHAQFKKIIPGLFEQGQFLLQRYAVGQCLFVYSQS